MVDFCFLQTAHNLCTVYMRLKELGHPKYLDRNFEDKLECSVPKNSEDKPEWSVPMSMATQKVCSTA